VYTTFVPPLLRGGSKAAHRRLIHGSKAAHSSRSL
jgi:hypothetical protein